METEEQYISIKELKTILESYPFQYIICGECAIDLFLSEYTQTKEIMSITKSRNEISDLNTYLISKGYGLLIKTSLNKYVQATDKDIEQVDKYYIYDKNKNVRILKVFIYEKKDGKWQFNHDSNIEMEDYKIYFHSLDYDVRYLRPEIQMMYKLYQELRQDDIYHYQNLIQHLSYYQFFMLKKVIGEEKVNKIILAES